MTQMKYLELPLSKGDLSPDPIEQFTRWYQQAQSIGEIEPSAMTLATVNQQYLVSARMVLLKSFDHKGFVFFTNYLSPKSLSLQEIPKAALVFWWPICQRQVRITGQVTLLEETESDLYFKQRSRESRIAAIISKQSAAIPDRETILQQYQTELKHYETTDNIPRPAYWGGYLVEHDTLEFWQGRSHRLHDRFLYRKEKSDWSIQQLSP